MSVSMGRAMEWNWHGHCRTASGGCLGWFPKRSFKTGFPTKMGWFDIFQIKRGRRRTGVICMPVEPLFQKNRSNILLRTPTCLSQVRLGMPAKLTYSVIRVGPSWCVNAPHGALGRVSSHLHRIESPLSTIRPCCPTRRLIDWESHWVVLSRSVWFERSLAFAHLCWPAQPRTLRICSVLWFAPSCAVYVPARERLFQVRPGHDALQPEGARHPSQCIGGCSRVPLYMCRPHILPLPSKVRLRKGDGNRCRVAKRRT